MVTKFLLHLALVTETVHLIFGLPVSPPKLGPKLETLKNIGGRKKRFISTAAASSSFRTD